MNIQARKLSLIEEFLKISDVSVIEKLESFLRTEKERLSDRKITPMSEDEFYEMIGQAKKDKVHGRVVPHEELKERIKSWR